MARQQGRLSDPFFSLIVFSVYSGLMGAILLFVPRTVLPWFGVRDEITSSTYMLGFVLLASSFYYCASGIGKDRFFAQLTVYTRFASPIVTIALYLTGNAPATYVPLSILDALGGVWTLAALRKTPVSTAPGDGRLKLASRA